MLAGGARKARIQVILGTAVGQLIRSTRQEDCKVGLAEQRQGWQRSYGFVGGRITSGGAIFMEVLYDAPSSGVAG